jgi:hypothetical protein
MNKSLRFVILLFVSGLKFRLAGGEDDATIVVKVGAQKCSCSHFINSKKGFAGGKALQVS